MHGEQKEKAACNTTAWISHYTIRQEKLMQAGIHIELLMTEWGMNGELVDWQGKQRMTESLWLNYEKNQYTVHNLKHFTNSMYACTNCMKQDCFSE